MVCPLFVQKTFCPLALAGEFSRALLQFLDSVPFREAMPACNRNRQKHQVELIRNLPLKQNKKQKQIEDSLDVGCHILISHLRNTGKCEALGIVQNKQEVLDFKMCITGKIHLTDLLWTKFSMASRYHSLEAGKCLFSGSCPPFPMLYRYAWIQQDWSHARIFSILSMEDST